MSEDRDPVLSRLQGLKSPASAGGSVDDRLAKLWPPNTGGPEGEPAEAKAHPSDSLWEGIKKFASKPVGEALEDLGRGAREIPGRVAEIGGNLAKGLMPTEAGARAGGEAVRQLGDVGAFASGGLTNPLRPAMGAPASRPQIAPPQAMAAPGGPAIPPGQGIRSSMPGAVPSAPSAKSLLPPGAEMGEPSKFASAIFSNDPGPIDRALTRQYRQVIKPGGDASGMAHQDRQIMTAVDSIIDAAKNENVRFTDANDRELPAGKLPSSLKNFVEGIDELSTQVFKEYDGMARAQGAQGVQVPLQPALAKLQEIASENPELAGHAEARARKWAEAGQYSPLQMQNVIKSLYKSTQGLAESVGEKDVLAQVLPTLKKTLNDTMGVALQSPQYQGLRNRYSALTSIEDDVANAFRKDLAKRPGGLADKLTDTSAAFAAMHGILSHDPRTMGAAVGVEALKYLRRYLSEPNRAVSSMFRRRAAEIAPPMADQMGAARAAGPISLGVSDEGRRRDLSLYPHVSVSGP
jgi:hypothetical protein